MRVDPSHLGNALQQLGGGALDAAQGEQTARQGREVEKESRFEPVDSLLLRRMKAAEIEGAASSASSVADARELVERTRQLMIDDDKSARAAQGDIARDRLRDLLGG